jgi:hypothetical protein
VSALGWLLGHAWGSTHRDRKSGLIRRTVLEVLQYDLPTREVLVVSGWEGKFVGALLGIDPDAEEAALRARLEAFFRECVSALLIEHSFPFISFL